MAEQSLEDLKAENAREEEAETETPHVEDEATDEPAVEDEPAETDDLGEGDKPDADKTETEDWMKGDEDANDGSQPSAGKFDDSDMAKTRRKYRAKLVEKDDELDKLRRENAELKKPTPRQPALNEPKRDDYDNDDDYTKALVDYRVTKNLADEQSQHATDVRTQKQNDKALKTETAVTQHYERAVKLAEASNITPEMYQTADLRVRTMIDGLFPKAGDAITDSLIAGLGEGSEKVLYNLGVNNSRLMELKARFEADRTGVTASMYIGKLLGEIATPRKRTTTAPKPAPVIQGDKVTTAEQKAFKREYDNADKRGDLQARFKARREARKAGVDTSTW